MNNKNYVIYGCFKGDDSPYRDINEVFVDSYVTLEAAMEGWSAVLQLCKVVCDYSKFFQEPGKLYATYRLYADVRDNKHYRIEHELIAECEVLPIPNR